MNTRRLVNIFYWVAVGVLVSGLAFAEHGGVLNRPEVDPTLASYVPERTLTGRLAVAGSETMQPLVARLAAEFRNRYPGIKVGIEGGGTNAAMTGFFQGLAQSRRGDGNVRGHLGSNDITLMASSREMTEAEVKSFIARYGYEPTAIPIAMDAVAVYVHKDNPVTGLTLEQVDALFSADRRRGLADDLKVWGQLGLTGEWTNAPVRMYGRNQKSGTRAFFQHHVLLDGGFKPSVKEEPGSATVVLDLSRDRFGIGYTGMGYQASAVRPLPIALKAGMPFVVPNAETTEDGSYPLRRFLYLYVNRDPKEPLDTVVEEFLTFINSREGQETVVRAGFYPLPMPQVVQNLIALAPERS
jgi:phosphate transport system substrate-binding protein